MAERYLPEDARLDCDELLRNSLENIYTKEAIERERLGQRLNPDQERGLNASKTELIKSEFEELIQQLILPYNLLNKDNLLVKGYLT